MRVEVGVKESLKKREITNWQREQMFRTWRKKEARKTDIATGGGGGVALRMSWRRMEKKEQQIEGI